MKRFPTCKRGTTAVEFALIAPVFILLLAGILFYGMYFGVVNSVQHVASEAARAAIGGMTAAERQQLAVERAREQAAGNPMLDPALMLVTVVSTVSGMQVRVRYDLTAVPIWSLGAFLPVPATFVERVGTISTGH